MIITNLCILNLWDETKRRKIKESVGTQVFEVIFL